MDREGEKEEKKRGTEEEGKDGRKARREEEREAFWFCIQLIKL